MYLFESAGIHFELRICIGWAGVHLYVEPQNIGYIKDISKYVGCAMLWGK